MRALILAGGLGTRLRSVVSDRPKPLASVEGVPFLEHQLLALRQHEIRDFVFLIGFRGEQIQDHFGDGAQWGVSVNYSLEPAPLGTAGAIKLAAEHVDDTCLVVNGDTHFDFDLVGLVARHRDNVRKSDRCLATIALADAADASQFGSVTLDDAHRIVSFDEKSDEAGSPRHVSAGVYVVEPRLLDQIPPSRKVSLEQETFPGIVRSSWELHGFFAQGRFFDIGTPSGLSRFQDYYRQRHAPAFDAVTSQPSGRPTSS